MSLVALRTLSPSIACLATGAVLVVPLVGGTPLLPGATDLTSAVPNALHHARIALAGDVERTLQLLAPLANDAAQADAIVGTGAGAAQIPIGALITPASGVTPYLAPGRSVPLLPVATASNGIDTAAVDRFSVAALRVAVASSNPAQDLQAIGGVLAALVQSVIDSLGTTPAAIQSALEALGNGDVNGAFGALETLILTPVALFAIGPGPQTIADALTDLFPPGAPVFQVLPSVTTNVGLGLADVYISTRQAIVDAVTSSVNSIGTLNPLVIASTIAAGVGTVSAKLFDGAFGPTGVIATLVRAGQQIFNALVPQQATQAILNTDAKMTSGAAQKVTPLSFTHATEAGQDTASKSDAPRNIGTSTTNDASSSTTTSEDVIAPASSAATTTGSTAAGSTAARSTAAASTSVGDDTATSGSTQTSVNGTASSDSASSDSSTSGKTGASSGEGHGAGPSSGSTGAETSATAAPAQHEASSTSDHRPTGAGSHLPGRSGSGATGEAETSKPHDATHTSAGGASSAASDRSSDK
jgi:hypothetical protein